MNEQGKGRNAKMEQAVDRPEDVWIDFWIAKEHVVAYRDAKNLRKERQFELLLTNLDYRTSVGGALLDLWRVGGAVLKDRLVVVDVGDENDNHGRRGVHLQEKLWIFQKKIVIF